MILRLNTKLCDFLAQSETAFLPVIASLRGSSRISTLDINARFLINRITDRLANNTHSHNTEAGF